MNDIHGNEITNPLHVKPIWRNTHHVSTVRANTVIDLDRAHGSGRSWVRVKTAGVVTWERFRPTANAGYDLFEKAVERHELGEGLEGL